MGCGASSAAVASKVGWKRSAASKQGDSTLTSSFSPAKAQEATQEHSGWRGKVDHVPDIYQKEGYRIKDTAERGISLRQLQDLGAFIEIVLSTPDVDITDRDGVAQTWEIVNLYVINTYFVKPLTWGEQISFVELVAESDQPPSWFISHWWGTAFHQSLRMLRMHHKTRGLEESSCYWMCTFANNQHALDEELNGELADCPFLRVLRSDTCCGTVALMDRNATPFSRIWCVLEAFEAMKLGETKAFVYDMGAWLEEGHLEKRDEDSTIRCAAQASILLDDKVGTTACEEAERDWEFPWIVSEAAVRTNVKEANSTMPEDKAAILDYIHGREEELNARIHSQVSRAAMQSFCMDGRIAMIQELLGEFPSLLDAPLNNFGSTPSYIAAEKGQPEVLELLISSRADIDKPSENDATPTFIAAAQGNIGCLQLLISSRADINRTMNIGASPTFIAAQLGEIDALRLLVSSRADIDQGIKNGCTPLFMTAKNGHVEGLKLLISSRADIEKSREDGLTPTFAAAQLGRTDVLELLIASRADINKSRSNGATPACIAAWTAQVDALRLLIASRADVDKCTDTGATPTYVAAQLGHVEVLKLLITSRADMNKSGNDGATPVYLAAQEGHIEALRLLMSSRADVNKSLNNGATPLTVAEAAGHVEVAEELLNADAERHA